MSLSKLIYYKFNRLDLDLVTACAFACACACSLLLHCNTPKSQAMAMGLAPEIMTKYYMRYPSVTFEARQFAWGLNCWRESRKVLKYVQ